MAEVREEAEKKSFWQKWFHPWQVKIPVQVFATVCIAVLALYLYRVNEQRTKEIAPSPWPSSVTDIQESHRMPSVSAPSVEQSPIRKEPGTHQTEKSPDGVSEIPAAGPAQVPEEDQTVLPKRANDVAAGADAKEKATAPESVPQKRPQADTLAVAPKPGPLPSSLSAAPAPDIVLRVAHLSAGEEKIRNLLIHYKAQNIREYSSPNKTLFTVQLRRQNIKAFLSDLNTIGDVVGKNIPLTPPEEEIVTIAIEISGNE